MNKVLTCRRSTLALIGMLLLTILGILRELDVSAPIAAIAMGVAAANSYEKKKKNEPKT